MRSVRFSDEIRPVALPGLLHSMSTSSLAASLPADGRQSPTALAIARGVRRLMHAFGYSVISELPLASGRRADLVGLGSDGEIWIIEIKSSVADLRADQKWMDYRLHCDRLFFATTPDVPRGIFPNDAGLMLADAYGAAIICEAPKHRLHHATRRTMMLGVCARGGVAPFRAFRSAGHKRRAALANRRRPRSARRARAP